MDFGKEDCAVDQAGIVLPERLVSQVEVDAAPIIYTDGPIGIAMVGDVLRITLGAQIFNADPASDIPKLRPVANIVIDKDAALDLIGALMEYVSDDDADQDVDDKLEMEEQGSGGDAQ